MEKQYSDIIDNALSDDISRKVAKMMATSHEYKTPNIDGALAIAKNYKWTLSTMKISNLQGINKPVIKEKVFNIATGIKKNNNKVEPFIVVNKLDGVYPQSIGKKLLLDGHHRKEACELLGLKEVPVYLGIFTGGSQKSKEQLQEKEAHEMSKLLEKLNLKKEASYQALEELEKSAGIKSALKGAKDAVINTAKKTGIGSAISDYSQESNKLKKMQQLKRDAIKAGNTSRQAIADAGINEFTKSKNFMKTVVKDEAGKAAKKVAIVGAGAATGAAIGKKIENKKEKTAFELLNDFAKLAEILSPEELEVTASEVLESMEKQADLRGFITGQREISEDDLKTKFWKDRIGGKMVAGIPASIAANTVGMLPTSNKGGLAEYIAKYILGSAASIGTMGAIETARGRNLAKTNNVDWKGSDTVKSMLIPFASPESVIKKKLRKQQMANGYQNPNRQADIDEPEITEDDLANM